MFAQPGSAQTKAFDLATTVSAAVSPPQISSACAAVESFLQNHTPDHQRWFFSITFPTLLCKLFGFDDSSPSLATGKVPVSNGWIDVASSKNDTELAGKIFTLLSPNGILLSSIVEIDQLSLVKYFFPTERLPEWCSYLLQSENNCRALKEIFPLFKRRIKEAPTEGSSYKVQLNVFDYYFFWFAYYPVYRGNRETSEALRVHKVKRFTLENWSHSIPVLSITKRDTDKKKEDNLYIRLIYVYLHTFAPLQVSSLYETYSTSLLQCIPAGDCSFKERAVFVVNTLIYFWLVDNDYFPFSMDLCNSIGVSFPVKSIQREVPPSPGVGDVINVFIKYLNMSLLEAVEKSNEIEFSSNMQSRFPSSFDNLANRCFLGKYSVGSWNLNIQRALYRYILRTLLFCPVESSTKNAFQAFSVWVNYMEPWSNNFDEFAGLNETNGLLTKSSANLINKSSPGYSPFWQQYVLINYLFYSSLVMHFIDFAHRSLHSDIDLILNMVTKVLNILTSSVELRDLIKNVEDAFHSKVNESMPSLNYLSKSVATIQEQLECWEYGLCENDVDGPFLHEKRNRDLLLFSSGEDGGQQLLHLLLVRTDPICGSSRSQDIELLKSKLSLLFGASSASPSSETPKERDQQPLDGEIFKPKSFGNPTVTEIKYKGDWMKRPFSNDEIAWLASLLVGISLWLNEKLGLNQGVSNQRHKGWSYVQVHSDERSAHGTVETLKVVFDYAVSWIGCLADGGIGIMRAHGIRVNLRMLASKRIVVMFLVIAAFSVLKKGIWN